MNIHKNNTIAAGEGRELLQILATVDANSSVSQRHIAAEVGIALGMVNTYLQRCIRKGWIVTQKVPARGYAYILTPQGLAEKTRLVKAYMQSSLSLFREAREQFDFLFEEMNQNGIMRVGVVGSGDLQDIGLLVAHSYTSLSTVPINAITNDMNCGAYIVTDMDQPQKTYDKLCKVVNAACVYPLPLLRIKATEGKVTND